MLPQLATDLTEGIPISKKERCSSAWGLEALAWSKAAAVEVEQKPETAVVNFSPFPYSPYNQAQLERHLQEMQELPHVFMETTKVLRWLVRHEMDSEESKHRIVPRGSQTTLVYQGCFLQTWHIQCQSQDSLGRNGTNRDPETQTEVAMPQAPKPEKTVGPVMGSRIRIDEVGCRASGASGRNGGGELQEDFYYSEKTREISCTEKKEIQFWDQVEAPCRCRSSYLRSVIILTSHPSTINDFSGMSPLPQFSRTLTRSLMYREKMGSKPVWKWEPTLHL